MITVMSFNPYATTTAAEYGMDGGIGIFGLFLALGIAGAAIWFLFIKSGRGKRIVDKTTEEFREDAKKVRSKLDKK